jgi:2'-5' RNA ligase
VRAFIAIELIPELKEQLIRQREHLRRELAGTRVSWVRPQGMHLTLKFLGEIEEGQVAPIGEQMALLGERFPPFEMQLTALGAFPNMRRPRVVWVGVEAPPALAALQADLERALKKLGFAAERRPFHPHITLGRVRDAGGGRVDWEAALARAGEAALGGQRVEGFCLFRSQLQPTGAVYTRLREVALRGSHES